MPTGNWRTFWRNGWGVALFSLGLLVGSSRLPNWFHPPSPIKVALADNEPKGDVSLLRKTSESFRAVAKRVSPAVVNIKAQQAASSRLYGPDGDEFPGQGPNDPFFDFFQGFGFPQRGNPPPQAAPTALGSGIILDKRGYILTNNHVVAHSRRLHVILSDDESREIPATLVGADPRTDLAVVKINPPGDLPTAEWADSDNVEVGDWAVAIGSPFMLSHSVTAGIVSAKGRNTNELMGSGFGYGMIQTDAAINPGNSGGPLCTIDGKVMGVNTSIYSKSGGYMGIGFAIPSNLARDVARTLIEKGKVVRGWLGISIQKLDPELASDLGIDHGVLVHQVDPQGPAGKSGVRPGDVVLEVNGKAVKDPGDLQMQVSMTKPGEKLSLKVEAYQDKQVRTIDVKVGEASVSNERIPGPLPRR